MKKAKPFLKWAGGKSQLLKDILPLLSAGKNNRFIYVEPFIGSGAVLFEVLYNYKNLAYAVINDINPDLINVYRSVKHNVEQLIDILDRFQSEYHFLCLNNRAGLEDYYYEKRYLYNQRCSDDTTQAALLIFLNRTCFNGLYRVNKNNEFNVPIGSYKKPAICDRENLTAANAALRDVIILNGDFEITSEYMSHETFFYFDPPYKPISPTSAFTSYSKYIFDDSEQIRLKCFCDRLHMNGCRWILSNSDLKHTDPENNFFDDLYKDYSITRINAKRSINASAEKRGQITELLITNQR